MNKKEAEKFFNKKASPDSFLTPQAFIKKKVTDPIKNYGRNVKGGARIVGNAVKNKVLKAFKK